MNLKNYLGPVVHSLRTLPDMLLEVSKIPIQIKRQEKDWKRLIQQIPRLSEIESQLKQLKNNFSAPHRDYIFNYSAPLISLSLERAAFIYYLSSILRPKQILDLGSGFSTYVFSQFAKNADNGCEIVSVDTSSDWLKTTESFLKKYDGDNVQFADIASIRIEDQEFDLCFLDIGDIEFRLKLLELLLEKIKNSTRVLIIDDFHVPNYRRTLIQKIGEYNLNLYSLRKYTRTRLSHAALVSDSSKETP